MDGINMVFSKYISSIFFYRDEAIFSLKVRISMCIAKKIKDYAYGNGMNIDVRFDKISFSRYHSKECFEYSDFVSIINMLTLTFNDIYIFSSGKICIDKIIGVQLLSRNIFAHCINKVNTLSVHVFRGVRIYDVVHNILYDGHIDLFASVNRSNLDNCTLDETYLKPDIFEYNGIFVAMIGSFGRRDTLSENICRE